LKKGSESHWGLGSRNHRDQLPTRIGGRDSLGNITVDLYEKPLHRVTDRGRQAASSGKVT
jgi:hypothetical protein